MIKKNNKIYLLSLAAISINLFLAVITWTDRVVADTVPPTVSILSPADGKKVYATNDTSYPIKVVFSAWDNIDGIRLAGASSFVLKWWQGASSGSIDMTSSLSSWGPTDTLEEVYRSFNWTPVSGSGAYTIQVLATDKSDNVGKSRKVDIKVAISPLNNYSGFPGDGTLLVRDNDNTICMSCHELKSHSSANVESTKYGNWERVCRDCHTPHNTKNIFLLASSFKIYTGIDQSYAYNKRVDFRNLSGESTYGFVTKTGNTRRGPCEVCHTRTENLDNTPRWRNYTSEPDIDGKKHNAGVRCINCHPHTKGFKGSCDSCHGFPPTTVGTLLGGVDNDVAVPASDSLTNGSHEKHINIFGKVSATCDYCHGGGMGETGRENDDIDIDFDAFSVYTTGDYTGQEAVAIGFYGYSGKDAPAAAPYDLTCNNVKCHGAGWLTGGNDPTPVWGDPATGQCGKCHGVKKTPGSGSWPNTGAHIKHVSPFYYDFMCKLCHSATVLGTSTTLNNLNHVNGASIVQLYTSDSRIEGFGGYTDTTVNSTYEDCTNTYCHSMGNRFSNFSAPNVLLNWTSTRACNSCHGNNIYGGYTAAMPNYPNGSPKENSHPAHVLMGYECKICHASTTDDNVSIRNTAVHVNGFYNVSVGYGKVEGTYYAYSTSTKKCYNVTCHGGSGSETPSWGGTANCEDCHVGSSDIDDFTFFNNTTARLSQTEWETRGHGRPAGSLYPFSNNSSANKSCRYTGPYSGCHSSAVPHGTETNPFRLYTSPSYPDGLCLECHKTGVALPVVTHSMANMSAAGWENGGPSGNWGVWDFTPKCVDCHDPHGDKNNKMIHTYYNMSGSDAYGRPTDGATAFMTFTAVDNDGQMAINWQSFVKPDFSGICQRCHTAGDPGVMNFTKGEYNLAHNWDTPCTNCHDHTKGFKPEPTTGDQSCKSCHNEFFEPMNQVNNGYHHYLNNSDIDGLTGPGPSVEYPIVNPPVALAGVDVKNRRCLMCHVNHNIFKPELNPLSPGVSYNLRPSIAVLPTTTSGRNTDFVPEEEYGGICLSCHQNSQTKSYEQPDGTVVTPVINKGMFIDSPHNYTAPIYFKTGGSQFNANCSKCHIDTSNKTKQVGGSKIGPHFSQIRRINAVGINENNYGIVTGGSGNTLTNLSSVWVDDMWAGDTVYILDGAGAGQSSPISFNDGNTLTLGSSLSHGIGSIYLIGVSRGVEDGISAGGNTTSTVKRDPTDAPWVPNYWKDRPVTITEGKGYGQTSRILSNTTSTLTLNPAFPLMTTVPDNTSRYSLGDPSEEEVCFRCHSDKRNPYGNAAAGNKDFFGQKVFDNTKALRMEKIFNDPAKPYKHRIDKYFAKHRGDESETAPAGLTSEGWFNLVSGGTHTGCQDCHNPHANRHPGEDSGLATGGFKGDPPPTPADAQLIDTTKNWVPDQWRGYVLRGMVGTNIAGLDRVITGNTSDTLYVSGVYPNGPPQVGDFYVIQPFGHPEKGNSLWAPNNGIWGVLADYTTSGVGTYTNPTFTKDPYLEAGVDKLYNLCLKCHSDYAWGEGGTPFSIPDSILSNSSLGEGPSTNIAQEINPNNLGHHAIVSKGNNQPIDPTGFDKVSIFENLASTGSGSTTHLAYPNAWNPRKYNGYCVEITAGAGAGQIRTITNHDYTGITKVDPYFNISPNGTSVFAIRKCSSYSSSTWPRFTLGTLTLTDGSATATISGLNNGIPKPVIRGWYIYAGDLRTGNTNSDTPSPFGNSCGVSRPCPPTLSTSGWFQIKEIETQGASDPGKASVDFTITPTPTGFTGSTTVTYALSAGLGNAFVPPYGPWSVMGCAECHDADDSDDPSGPHASSRNWMMRTLEAQAFTWFYGGIEESTSTTDESEVKFIMYGDGADAGWATGLTEKYICMNCHRADVYKTEKKIFPVGANFYNFSWRNLGRQSHPVIGYADDNANNKYGIYCMHCHGGDNRAKQNSDPKYQSLGGFHGSNLGIGMGGSSFRGRRLLNGSRWTAVTRASTEGSDSYCLYNGSNIGGCSGGYGGFNASTYPYYSGADIYLPVMTSAVASDDSGRHTGVQNGDKVIITFDGETNEYPVTAGNIDTVLNVSGKTWGSIVDATWTTVNYERDTLMITLDSDATIAVGDTIVSNGDIKTIIDSPITNSVVITGNFGWWVVGQAFASDASGGGYGIQTGDQVVLSFDDQTAATPITSANINTALPLDGKTWLDGGFNIYSSGWSTVTNLNDTLTVTLSAATPPEPTVDILDVIDLQGATIIKDAFNVAIQDNPFPIVGSFDSIPTGAVAQWRLDEGSGNRAYNDTGNYNHGTIVGTATWTTGKKDGALYVNKVSYTEVEDHSSLDIGTGSIELWVKKDDLENSNNYQTMIWKSSAYGIREYTSNSSKLQFYWGSNNIITDIRYNSGAWYHIVGTCDGTTMRLYLNGEEVKNGACSSYAGNNNKLYIGSGGLTSYRFDGIIDNVVLYNQVLGPTTVRRRFNRIRSATAVDNNATEGLQAGDQVIIRFNGAVQAPSPAISKDNIDAILGLSGSHTWRDTGGAGDIGSAVWNNVSTLTVTLSDAGVGPTVSVGDVITLDGSIRDTSGQPIFNSIQISGTFGTMAGMLDGLVGYWPMDENLGTTINDGTLYNNHGALNISSWQSLCRFGPCVNFIPNRYVNIPDSNQIDLTRGMSIEFWMTKRAHGSLDGYVSKGSLAVRDGNSSSGDAGKLEFIWHGVSIKTPAAVPTDQLKHVVATYDNVSSVMKLYVNANLEASETVPFIMEPDTSPLYIGRYSSSYIDGIIDDVALYNRALTQTEITNRYGANLVSARAIDPSQNGKGINMGDQVLIKFNGSTQANVIDKNNINTAISLSSSHNWLDNGGAGDIVSAVWSNNSTVLTITLSDTVPRPTVAVGDTVTLTGTIKDTSGRPINGETVLYGTFDSIPDGAVGYWSMDEGGGSFAYDATDNENHGVLYNSANLTASGYYSNSAATFDGTNDYIRVNYDSSLTLGAAGTVEFWAKKSDNYSSGQVFISRGNGYRAFINARTGKIFARWGSATNTIQSSTVMTNGVWHHIALTYDQSLPSNELKLYINGKLDTEASHDVNDSDSSNPLDFGGIGQTSDYDGELDNVVVYNVALDADEIRKRYGTQMVSADADDNSGGGKGVQAGDGVTIFFNMTTGGEAITSGNIASALPLNSGSWGTSSGSWDSPTNKTLTITLGADATVGVGDTIAIDGSVITDMKGDPVESSIAIRGSFGAIAGMPDGVVGYWDFNETSGTFANDTSGYGNDVTTSSNPPFVSTGRFDYALNFIANNDYAYITDSQSNSLDLTKTGSVEIWVRKDRHSDGQVYYQKGGILDDEVSLHEGPSGKVDFYWGTGVVTSVKALDIDVWNHVIGTYDGENLTIYINGQFDNQEPYKTTSLPPVTAAALFARRGYDQNPGGRWGNFDGTLDNVVVYNRALTSGEVDNRFINTFRDIYGIDNTYGGIGAQAGDYAIISFVGETNGAFISSTTINTVLNVSGKTWLDGSGNIAYANWSSVRDTNDTLLIGLSGGGNQLATVAGGD
ncbi:MAG: CxxxxCH/CxxCH domain-containing protein, partial [Deltaproteobacteria bacterium]|nr:CxxxxCH/CxxCH domain-containing protein [Deltaproteobacteria bacterium]